MNIKILTNLFMAGLIILLLSINVRAVYIVPSGNVYEMKSDDTINIDATMYDKVNIEIIGFSIAWVDITSGQDVKILKPSDITQTIVPKNLFNGKETTILKLDTAPNAKSKIYRLSVTLIYPDDDRKQVDIPPITLIVSDQNSPISGNAQAKGVVAQGQANKKVLSVKIPSIYEKVLRKGKIENEGYFAINIKSEVKDDIEITDSKVIWIKKPEDVENTNDFNKNPTIKGEQNQDYNWKFSVGSDAKEDDYEMILVVYYKKGQENGFLVVDPILHLYREEIIRGYSLGLYSILILVISLLIISIYTMKKLIKSDNIGKN